MEVRKLSEFTRGWIIGDFEPALFKSKDFEVALLSHKKGEVWPAHYHMIATEYNVLVSGKMIIRGMTILPNDVFVLSPNEIADPVFLDDCTVLCIKTPSIIGDKYEVL